MQFGYELITCRRAALMPSPEISGRLEPIELRQDQALQVFDSHGAMFFRFRDAPPNPVQIVSATNSVQYHFGDHGTP